MPSLHVFLLVPQLVNDYPEIKNTCELLERKRILKKKKKRKYRSSNGEVGANQPTKQTKKSITFHILQISNVGV